MPATDHNFSPSKLCKWHVRFGLNTMHTSSRNANSSSPSNISCFASFNALSMARRGSPCSPPSCLEVPRFVLPHVSGRLGVSGPDKRQEGAEPWHLQQFRHHCAPEHMVVRSNSVDGEECRCVPHAVDSGTSGQRELDWSTRCFDLLAELLRQGLGQPTYGNVVPVAMPHATVLLLQGRQNCQSETMAHTTRNIPSGKLIGCTIQHLKGFLVIQTHLQHFVRASSGLVTTLLAHFADNWRTT